MATKADDYTIIAIYNHPTSSVPSISDLISAKKIKYKYGIAVGHDGSIYKYTVAENFNEPIADGGLELLQKVKYTDDERKRAEFLERALKMLRDAGVEMEVLG